MSNRKKIIKEFTANDKSILCTARVLNEGVNIPCIDGICFVDPRNSTIDIVQCIGRGLRLYEGKKVTSIYVPIFIENIDDESVEDDKIYGNIIKILKAMKSTDDGVTEYFTLNDNQKRNSTRRILITERFVKINKSQEIDLEKWSNKIDCKIWQLVDPWNAKFEKLKMWITKNRKRPSSYKKDNIEEKRLGQWFIHQFKVYKKNKEFAKDQDKRTKWEKFLDDNKQILNKEELWNNKMSQLEMFLIKNKRRPFSNSRNKIERQLGQWLIHQTNHYNKNMGLLKNQSRRARWKKFINDNKKIITNDNDKWNAKMKQLEIWVIENNRRPTRNSINIVEKQLAIWVDTQQTKYNMNIMEGDRCKKWEKFINNNKHIMKTIDEKWYNTLQSLEIWIKQNNRKPIYRTQNKEEKYFAKWIRHQRDNYNKNIKSMKDPNKRLKWKEFVNDNKQIMMNENDRWHDNMEHLKMWVITTNKRPLQKSQNAEEKQLAHWICTQQNNYSKNVKSMKDKNKRIIWEEFIKLYPNLFKVPVIINDVYNSNENNNDTNKKIVKFAKKIENNVHTKKNIKKVIRNNN